MTLTDLTRDRDDADSLLQLGDVSDRGFNNCELSSQLRVSNYLFGECPEIPHPGSRNSQLF